MSTANGSTEAALQTGSGATAADGSQGPFPVQNRNKRGPVACKRCRRAKTKVRVVSDSRQDRALIVGFAVPPRWGPSV
jgi:hypothetical protein